MLSTLALILGLAAAPPEEAVRMIKSAEVAMAESRTSDAIVLAEQALKLAPDAWQAHKIAGEALMHLDRAREALPHLRRWAELRPDDPHAAASAALAEKRIGGSFSASGAPAGPAADKAAAAHAPTPPPLGEVARRHAETADKSPGAPAGSAPGAEATPPPVLDDAEVAALRRRADKALRPRMVAAAPTMKQLRADWRLYRGTCHGQQLGLAGRETIVYGSETTWLQSWAMPEGVAPGGSPQCQTLFADIKARLAKSAGALAGADRALNTAPAVAPAIREDVFEKLVLELW